MKVLLYDLEISPMLCWAYEMWDARVLKVERDPYILCFSYVWEHDGKIKNVAQPDFRTHYKRDPYSDERVVNELWGLMNEADIVVAHNAKKFDNRIATARFLAHGMLPPAPYKTVDTLTAARKYFRFPSNALATLCEQLELGTKTKITHGMLWHDCINGDKGAWEQMRVYCNRDVELLSNLYYMLKPYIGNHPNVNHDGPGCPRCGSKRIQWRGEVTTNVYTYRRFQCQECGAWSRERKALDNHPEHVSLP